MATPPLAGARDSRAPLRARKSPSLPNPAPSRRVRPEREGGGRGAGVAAESAFRALLRLYGQLQRVLHPYFAGFGISGSQWGVLRALHRAHGEGLAGVRLTELSTRLLIRPPSVTAVIDRLERSGLVARGASAEDRRARPVRLTAAGRELVGRVLRRHGQQIELLMAGLSAPEQGELHRLLERLEGHVGTLQAGGVEPEPAGAARDPAGENGSQA